MVATRRCYVCESEVEMKTYAGHMDNHEEDLKIYRFSNDLADVCQTSCKICEKTMSVQRMRAHTKSEHQMVITEYRAKFNQNFFDLVEKIFHRCGICSEALLLDSDVISSHLNNNKNSHRMTHKAYNETFMQYNNNIKVKDEKVALEEASKEASNDNTDKDESMGDTMTVAEFQQFVASLQGGQARLSFPALEVLLGMDVTSEEAVLRAATTFSATL